MTRRTLILWALGVGQLLAAAIACAALEWVVKSEWIVLACLAILYAQPYLAGIWIGLGHRSLPWRVLAVAACLTGLTWLESLLFFGAENLVMWLSPGIAVALALMLLARAFGFRLRDRCVESQAADTGKYQFSLRSLLKWTTVIALLCSLAAMSNPAAFEEARGPLVEMMLIMLMVHVLFAGIAFTEFSVLLGMERPWIGLACLLPPMFTIIALIGWSMDQMPEFIWASGWLMAWFALCLLPLRLFGYRFGRFRSQPLAVTPLQIPLWTVLKSIVERADPMTRRTVILWALGAGQTLAALFACAMFESLESFWLVYPCVAILYAQPYLAGIWIGFGHRSLPWRMLAVVACLTGLTWLEPMLVEDIVQALSPGIAVALALMLPARAFGFRLRDRRMESQAAETGKYQFSLRSLLKWTTVIALLCSLAAMSNPAAFDDFSDMMLELLITHALIAGVFFAEFAILLGMRRPWIGLALLVPATLAIVWLLGRNTGQLASFLWGSGCLMVWFGLCLLPLRLFGYRFGRRRSQRQEEAIP